MTQNYADNVRHTTVEGLDGVSVEILSKILLFENLYLPGVRILSQ